MLLSSARQHQIVDPWFTDEWRPGMCLYSALTFSSVFMSFLSADSLHRSTCISDASYQQCTTWSLSVIVSVECSFDGQTSDNSADDFSNIGCGSFSSRKCLQRCSIVLLQLGLKPGAKPSQAKTGRDNGLILALAWPSLLKAEAKLSSWGFSVYSKFTAHKYKKI